MIPSRNIPKFLGCNYPVASICIIEITKLKGIIVLKTRLKIDGTTRFFACSYPSEELPIPVPSLHQNDKVHIRSLVAADPITSYKKGESPSLNLNEFSISYGGGLPAAPTRTLFPNSELMSNLR